MPVLKLENRLLSRISRRYIAQSTHHHISVGDKPSEYETNVATITRLPNAIKRRRELVKISVSGRLSRSFAHAAVRRQTPNTSKLFDKVEPITVVWDTVTSPDAKATIEKMSSGAVLTRFVSI